MSTAREDEKPRAAIAPAGDAAGHDDGLSKASPDPKETVALRMEAGAASADPPLPYEDAPPLPDEPTPDQADDGWEAMWDATKQSYYFYNHKTGISQWENPRIPEATVYPSVAYDRNHASSTADTSSPPRRKWGGYNPAIHGSYDPNADYAREATKEEEEEEERTAALAAAAAGLPTANRQEYQAQAHFNRFTGKFQQAEAGPDVHNDENKSHRQMAAFFDVDAAANSHDGRSLKAERRGKTLTKKELKAFKEKRHNKKEEKRRAWLLN